MHRDMKKILKALEKDGYSITYSRNGHPVIKKNGKHVAITSGTPSDWRSWKNFTQQLKRSGFNWPKQQQHRGGKRTNRLPPRQDSSSTPTEGPP